jgi:hypothetical protein
VHAHHGAEELEDLGVAGEGGAHHRAVDVVPRVVRAVVHEVAGQPLGAEPAECLVVGERVDVLALLVLAVGRTGVADHQVVYQLYSRLLVEDAAQQHVAALHHRHREAPRRVQVEDRPRRDEQVHDAQVPVHPRLLEAVLEVDAVVARQEEAHDVCEPALAGVLEGEATHVASALLVREAVELVAIECIQEPV